MSADAVFYIAAEVEKYVVICYNMKQGLNERIVNDESLYLSFT